MEIQLKRIDAETDNRWDEFVLNHPDGTIYHHSLWGKVVSKTYGYERCYLVLENEKIQKVEGVIPLMFVSSFLTGKRVVSLPLTSYCNPLFPVKELDKIVQFINNQFNSLDYMEFKFLDKIENNSTEIFEQSFHTTHILDLDDDLDKLFKSFHGSSVRGKIKKAVKNNLNFRISEDEKDLKEFYKLEIKIRKKHGLPPQPYAFFKNMWDYLKPKGYMFLPLIEHKNNIIAAAIMLKFKDTFYYEYAASDTNFWNLGCNQKLIWETIKFAHQNGAKKYDFGRSSISNQSLIEFKERWATKAKQLNYYYFPKTKKTSTDNNNNTIHRLLTFTNKHIPLPLLRLEGKMLYHHFG
ncbi:GNAT family N-acetyltransferase [candidate division KSB1 bacterium]|nr:GNAT family N-acetyltransferase [candidate division KSB1 bacterium]MBL7093230.1 GNAT family N-acetyltransferase [candidate division KSB1 bacterium]